MGIMAAEVLELGSCFELVSSPETKDRKVAALRHGFVHLCGNSVTPAPRRRALSAEARSSLEVEELAFARYVATFHFGRSSEPDNGAASPISGAKTPTGARRALVEFAIPAASMDCSSCGGDDAEASTEEPPSLQPSPTAAATASPPFAACARDGVEASTEEPCSSSMPAAAAPACPPPAASSSPTADLPREAPSTPRSFEMTLPARCVSSDASSVPEPVGSPSRMRKDAPEFVPGGFGLPPAAASQSPVRRGPLSTMPPNSPSGSFEAGARVPPPPPTSPPRVVSPTSPPGAFHSPPPRGVAGASCISQLPQRVPMPPTAAPKLTRALLRGSVVDKRVQAASVEDHSEYASLASHDSSTTAPPSVEEASEPLEVMRHSSAEQVQRRGGAGPSAGQGHFSQGRAGPRERAGTAPGVIHGNVDGDTKQDGASMRKKVNSGGGSPSNSRNLVWRPKRRSSTAA